MKKIAIEEHCITETFLEYLRSKASLLSPLVLGASLDAVDKRLKEMDEVGIDMQVLSIAIPSVEGFNAADGTALARSINDEFAEVARKYPERLAGFAAIAAQDPEAAADELERAVVRLGLKGAMIYSHIQGEYLDEEKYWVILERAEKLDVPIYLHPNLPSPDMIKPYAKYPALTRAMWGFAAETGLHAVRLICGGVFDKYPRLKIILGHMGESLPYWLWRLDAQWRREKTLEGARQIEKEPSQYIKENFYVTTSGMFWHPVLQFVCLTLGADRVLFAVDHPFESNQVAVEFIDSAPIADTDKEKICHLNAERLLKL